MIKIISINGTRNFDNPDPNPEGHWVELVFENDHGVHTLDLNGPRPLPDDPALKDDLEWLLWDYGLMSQQDGRTARQRARNAQELIWTDRRNYLLARSYMEQLGHVQH
jgi:hypothetical protein